MKITAIKNFSTNKILLCLIAFSILINLSIQLERNEEDKTIKVKRRMLYRKKYEVCYRSTPNWSRMNANVPCPPGTICRPPLNASRMGLTGVASKCYPDNKRGTNANSNFRFASNGSRKISTSYTYRYRESGGPWIYVAGPMQECYKAIPNFQEKKCLPGYICAPLRRQRGLSGVTSFCQKETEAKPVFLREGDKCGVSGGKMCPPSTRCRYQIKNGRTVRRGNMVFTLKTAGMFCLLDNSRGITIRQLKYTPANKKCKIGGVRCAPGNICRPFVLNRRNMGNFCLPKIEPRYRKTYTTRKSTTVIRYINGVKVSENTY